MTSDTNGNRPQAQLSNTLAAIFATEHDAREAIKELHKAGFRKTWLGVIKNVDGETGEPLVEDKKGLAAFILPDRLPLQKTLRQNGLSEQQAQDIEDKIAPGCAVLTVYGEDNPDRAIELLDTAKGNVIESDEAPEAVNIASASPRTGVDRDERKEADRERHPYRNGNGNGTSASDDRIGVNADRAMAGIGRDLPEASAATDLSEGSGTADRASYESEVYYQRP